MKNSPEQYKQHAVLFQEMGSDMLHRMQYFAASPRVILDLGAGPDVCTSLIHKQYPDAEIIGVDEDHAFIQYAMKSAPHHRWMASEYTKLPLPNAHVDVVFANVCLSRQDDLPQVLSEIRRVLKPNGVVFASVFGNETRAGRKVEERIRRFLVSETAELFTQNGFFDPVLEMDSITLRYLDASDFHSEMKALHLMPASHETEFKEMREATFDVILVHAFTMPPRLDRLETQGFSVQALRVTLKRASN